MWAAQLLVCTITYNFFINLNHVVQDMPMQQKILGKELQKLVLKEVVILPTSFSWTVIVLNQSWI